jgi:(p)ppGpp synthase/HD superfamily hydrolase
MSSQIAPVLSTGKEEVCYNCARFEDKNRGFVMALSSRFEEALVFATRLHAGQRRKGTAIPYISHLLGVTSLVLENGGDEDEAIAALLHDAIEDQGGAATREEIRRRFGDTVVAIVDGCTDAEVMPKPPWRGRKEAYIAHIRQASPSVRLVSAADKLHNARTILADYRVLGDRLWQRFTGGKEGTLWYYRSVVEALREVGPVPLVEELDRVVKEIERLAAENSSS